MYLLRLFDTSSNKRKPHSMSINEEQLSDVQFIEEGVIKKILRHNHTHIYINVYVCACVRHYRITSLWK